MAHVQFFIATHPDIQQSRIDEILARATEYVHSSTGWFMGSAIAAILGDLTGAFLHDLGVNPAYLLISAEVARFGPHAILIAVPVISAFLLDETELIPEAERGEILARARIWEQHGGLVPGSELPKIFGNPQYQRLFETRVAQHRDRYVQDPVRPRRRP